MTPTFIIEPFFVLVWGFVWGFEKVPKIDICPKVANKKKNTAESNDSTVKSWSCYPDSNWGPHPYQGCALPAEL